MSAGTVTMTCLMLLAGQAPADVYYTKETAVRLPIVPLDPARRQEVNKLLLHCSADRGQTWHLCASVDPAKEEFVFYAPGNGEFWFRMATLDRQNRQDPANLHQGPPDQKMIVDTIPPKVKITAPQRLGDDLVVGWEIEEANPEPESLAIEYRLLDGGPGVWLPMQLTPAPQGETRTKLAAPGAVAVRLRMRDRAGNVASAETTTNGATQQTAYSNPPPANSLPQVGGSLPLPPPQPKGLPNPVEVSPPPQAPIQTQPQGSLPAPPGGHVPSPPPVAPPGAGQPDLVPPRPNTNTLPQPVSPAVSTPPMEVVAKSGPRTPQEAPAPQAPQQSPASSAQRKPATPIQLVNERDILIEYELSRVGPGGIGSVMLYLTRDGGQTWEFFAEDPDAGASAAGAKYQRTLELPGEGIFGLSLVVLNKAKIGRKPPQPGDAPELAVEVDLTAPVAELSKPVPDPKKREALLLRWSARDKNLTDAPVTLEWAERKEGPWQTIGAELPNTGQHSWILPPRMPVWVFMRLRVRDRAGNEAVAVTEEAQLVDLTEPESRLIGVRTIPRDR